MNVDGRRLVYTVAEAAAMLGVGRSTVYDLIGRGELDALRLGRRVFVTRIVLAELLGFEPPLPGEFAVPSHESSPKLRSVPPSRSV